MKIMVPIYIMLGLIIVILLQIAGEIEQSRR
nr:MAG TPA: hypothetical protein [Bacteriophage sp.]